MTRYFKTGGRLSALLVMAVLHTTSAANPQPTHTVEQLVERALKQNAELGFYEAEVLAAKGQRTQSGLWKNPEFSREYGSRRVTDDAGILQGDGYTRSFAVTQTFEFPGKGSLRKAIANKNIELAELGLRQFRRTLEGQVRSLALQYLVGSVNADAAKEIGERSSGLIGLLRERPATGTQQLLELRVIEGSLLELHQVTKDFIQIRDEARIELNALLGWPASNPLNIESALIPPSKKIPDLKQLILLGMANNLQLKVRTVELERAVKEVSASKLEVAPDFSVGPFFSQDKAGDLEENFGASVSITLPLWNWNQGNIATAKAKQMQADALLLEARRKVESEIAKRYRSFELNRKLLEQMQKSTIGNLREASDLADRQYRMGAIGVQLFLEVQREFLNAQKTHNGAVIDTWKSLMDLELLTGGLEASEGRK